MVAPPQDVVFLLDIASAFFNNLSTDVIDFLISEGVQVPPRPPTINNHQGNQRLLMVKNAAAEVENKIRMIKKAVQPETRSLHTRTFLGILVGITSIKMSGLGSSFQSEGGNYMVAESLEGFVLASEGVDYNDPEEQVTMGIMTLGG